ncbi:MAG: hypothetical protein OXF02_03405 [Simkaniaceae bacterium]|nr:hypothetical protein [Simkaniaceae bacterium]
MGTAGISSTLRRRNIVTPDRVIPESRGRRVAVPRTVNHVAQRRIGSQVDEEFGRLMRNLVDQVTMRVGFGHTAATWGATEDAIFASMVSIAVSSAIRRARHHIGT